MASPPAAPGDVADIARRLEHELSQPLAVLSGGQPGGLVRVSDLSPLAGHAGVGFSFLADAGSERRKLVVRTIPAGVPANGPADVVRQAQIMRSLAGSGVPVPEILAFGDERSAFGRSFFIAEFVPGTALPEAREDQTLAHAALARRGIEVMARLHRVRADELIDVWGPAQGLRDEFDRLHRLFDRPTIDSSAVGRLAVLRDRLLARAPDSFNSGCVHGDMHFGNMIFGPAEVRAVIDWEIAFHGSTLLDLGMLAFYADPAAALPDHRYRAERWVISPDEMIDTYRAAWRDILPPGAIAWHRAFAGYRFAVITLFNEMLHRRGKKHDPMWADVIRSVPAMVEHSLEVLAAPRS
jgi:aminoglycoside phosphotransferase (APT) family kinase protein